jgi:hypothetical protein
MDCLSNSLSKSQLPCWIYGCGIVK